MINQTRALKLLTDVIRIQPTNVPFDLTKVAPELAEYLFSLQKFTKHGGCSVVVKILTGYAGKRYKGLAIITANSGFHLPVTKASLKPTTKGLPIKSNYRATVLAAMRVAIQPQIDAYRLAHKLVREYSVLTGNHRLVMKLTYCELTNKKLIGKCHVDHYGKPFIQLAEHWLTNVANYTSFSQVTLKRGYLVPELATSWFTYHLQHSQLRLVNGKANIKAGAHGYTSSVYR